MLYFCVLTLPGIRTVLFSPPLLPFVSFTMFCCRCLNSVFVGFGVLLFFFFRSLRSRDYFYYFMINDTVYT